MVFLFSPINIVSIDPGEVFIGFLLGGLKVRDHWEDLGVGGRITLR
jgi:predicted N-acetyltransferase YhbS